MMKNGDMKSNNRHYLLFYDTGHDYGETVFISKFRANSKGNIEDAKNHLLKKFGKIYLITQIRLDESN